MRVNDRIKKLTAVLLSAWIALASVLSVLGADSDAWQSKKESTQAHLQTLTPQVGSIGGEWLTIGLSRTGACTEEQKTAYLQAARTAVAAAGSNRLHPRKSSDNARVILALSALGVDPRSVEGYDLTASFADMDYVGRQGVNGVIWALIALDACGYPMPSEVRERMLQTLADSQHADGGWGLSDDMSDPDVTGMALTALAPYRTYDSALRDAADKGVAWLAGNQQDGGYVSYDDYNPESSAQVLTALSAMQIDAKADARFAALPDSILRFSVDGGFAHSLGGSYNQMATEQVYYAMVAYERLQTGQTALFDMTDVQDFAVPDSDGDGTVSIQDATAVQRFLAEFAAMSAPQQRLADLNRDGRVDIGDVTALQRLLAQ